MVKEYSTAILLILAFVLMKLWSEYQIAGVDALPSVRQVIGGLGVWLGLYLLVRSLKNMACSKPNASLYHYEKQMRCCETNSRHE